MKKLNVMSLFDGISGGQQALKMCGFEVENYYASEIENSSINITKKNFTNTLHIGDIRNINTKNFNNIDIVIGGSPCQSFSFAGKRNGMSTKDKIEINSLEQYLKLKNEKFEFDGYSYLFWEYVRILKDINPKYFLLENVKMSKKWQDVITNVLGVEPVKISSGLTSAQNRVRLYWTNIPIIGMPKDKKMFIDDILQKNIEHKFLGKHRQEYTNYNESKVDKSVFKNTAIQLGSSRQFTCSIGNNGKAFCVRKTECNGILDENFNIRKFTPIEVERLFNLPDDYTKCDGVSNTKRYEALGNGWEMGVICWIFSHIDI
mgnify:CR=1 FL=1